ncbi:hypothetical protein BGX21_003974 [Mortierella sp. AD011]|nr:hypothetical protein BGX21_003974 [Mortierella sp. AD011]
MAYKAFQERSWDSFWSRRDLMIAKRALQVNSATVAKKMGVEAQNAGFKEGRLGFRKYPTNLKSDESAMEVEVTDDSDESETEDPGFQEARIGYKGNPSKSDMMPLTISDSDDTESEVDPGVSSKTTQGVETITKGMTIQMEDTVNMNKNPRTQKTCTMIDPSSSLTSSLSNSKKRKLSITDEDLTSPMTAVSPEIDLSSRKERFAAMDQSQFWRLRSGRSVEEILFNASLKQEANFKDVLYLFRSYSSLFTEDEWREMKELDDFQLQKLPQSTEKYLCDVRKALAKGKHVASVPIPEEDQYSCELVLRSFLSWKQLYITKPCPFDNTELSESFWSREAWPIMKGLLSDVDGLTMIDGEKAGLESGLRKNKDRKADMEAPTPRRKCGRKLDLVARDTTDKRDWFIVESHKEWDEQSTKFLYELDVTLFRDLHLIASHRLQEQPSPHFRSQARFFAVYSGGQGFQTMEMKACPFSRYVMLLHLYDSHRLPSTSTTWKLQAQGLAHLLQVRDCIKRTMEIYNACLRDEFQDNDKTEDEDDDNEWLYSSSTRKVHDETLCSSPLDPVSAGFYI